MSISSTPTTSSLARPTAVSAPGLTAYGAKPPDPKAKARAGAGDFEASFLNSMFNQMFTAMDGDGPFGGSKGVGVWRSFLSEQYAKSFAQSGGIGIANQVYRSLLAQQEASQMNANPSTPGGTGSRPIGGGSAPRSLGLPLPPAP